MDRRPLVIAVLGAMATLAVVTLLLAIPAADRCTPTGRDLWSCLRDEFAGRYMTRGAPVSSGARSAEQPAPAPSAASTLPRDLLAGQPEGAPTVVAVADLAPSPAVEARDLVAPAAQAPASRPPVASPAAAPPSIAAPPPADPSPSPSAPSGGPDAAPPPTIDIIAFDGSGHVEGEGPEGARILLFLDDTLAGSTRVENGRWSVDGVDLGASLSQELRVEAHDWDTGELLGSSTFTIAIELPAPPQAALPPPALAPASAPATGAAAALDMPINAPDPDPPLAAPPASTPPPEPPPAAAAVAADPGPDPAPASTAPPPASHQDSHTVDSPAAAAPPSPSQPAAAPPDTPRRLPGLRPVTPRSTSPSVTLLKGGNSGSITTLGGD